jgi:hypothetical protein
MRKPVVAKPRPARQSLSLSRILPRLNLPRSAAAAVPARPRPSIGKPGRSVFGPRPSSGRPQAPAAQVWSAAPPSASHSTASHRGAHTEGASSEAAPTENGEALCRRCNHGQSSHPIRYHCDKYPHADPLLICGCEVDSREEICHHCGHKAHRHKPRHRCRSGGCGCWGFDPFSLD